MKRLSIMTFSSLVTLIFGLTPQAYGYTFSSSSAFSYNCKMAAILSNIKPTIVNSVVSEFGSNILAQSRADCYRSCEYTDAYNRRLSQQNPGVFYYDPMDLAVCQNNCNIMGVPTNPSNSNQPRNPNFQSCANNCYRIECEGLSSITGKNQCSQNCINKCD